MIKWQNPFRRLSRGEWILWLVSLATVLASFFLSPQKDILNVIASAIGVTALIFVAKGMILGQILTVVFSVFYGMISFYFTYYGEMITYLCMTAPIAVMSVISWLRHPYRDSDEVTVQRMSKKSVWIMIGLSTAVTAVFYFMLQALGNANLFVSTLSVTTSFMASFMTFMRSPFYALGYAANDVVLIILWVLASVENVAYVPMVLCFCMFLLNDLYGFYNWCRIEKRQTHDHN